MFQRLTAINLGNASMGLRKHLVHGFHTAIRDGQSLGSAVRTAKQVYAIMEPVLSQMASHTTKTLTSGVRQGAETYDDLKCRVADGREAVQVARKKMKSIGLRDDMFYGLSKQLRL